MLAFRQDHNHSVVLRLAAKAFEQIENLAANLVTLAQRMDDACATLDELRRKGMNYYQDFMGSAVSGGKSEVAPSPSLSSSPSTGRGVEGNPSKSEAFGNTATVTTSQLLTKTQYLRSGFTPTMQPTAHTALKGSNVFGQGAAIVGGASSMASASTYNVPVWVAPSLAECLSFLDVFTRGPSDATARLFSLAHELNYRIAGLYLHAASSDTAENANREKQKVVDAIAPSEVLVTRPLMNSTMRLADFPVFYPKLFTRTPEIAAAARAVMASSASANLHAHAIDGNEFAHLSIVELMVALIRQVSKIYEDVNAGGTFVDDSESSDATQAKENEGLKQLEGDDIVGGVIVDETKNKNENENENENESTQTNKTNQSRHEHSSKVDELCDAEFNLVPRSTGLSVETMTGATSATWSTIRTALARCRRPTAAASTTSSANGQAPPSASPKSSPVKDASRSGKLQGTMR